MTFTLLLVMLLMLAPGSVRAARMSSSHCVLPAFPSNGKYVLGSNEWLSNPGEAVRRLSILQYSCDPGFILSNEVSVCLGSNVWAPTPTPTCTKPCTLHVSYTVDYACYTPGNVRTPCQPTMPHDSYVLFECKPGHRLTGTQTLDEMRCQDGFWSTRIPTCDTDCGLESAEVNPFIIDAPIAKKDTLPWHVAAYRESAPTPEYICGGTLLSTRLVMSAAHCFYDAVNTRRMGAELFRAAANKHFQQWDHPAEAHAPKSEVQAIHIPDWYKGDSHNHHNDIALLVLKTPFAFSSKVAAICYDLSNQRFDDLQLKPGSVGKFAGWGVTEDEKLSQELRVLDVPFIDRETCNDEFKKYNSQRYVTEDKICAGFTNRSSGCQGDSGAGLVFPDSGEGERRWWLRGVLSTGLMLEFTCRPNTYITFTRVSKLKNWLKKQINLISSQLPEVADHSVNQNKKSSCALPEYPVHGKYSVSGSYQKAIVPGDAVAPFTSLNYSCDAGYETSHQISECRDDGSWTRIPVCDRVPDQSKSCPPLPEGAVTIVHTGQKAWEKCLELAEHVRPCNRSTGIRADACAHVATPLIAGKTDAVPGEFPHVVHIGSLDGGSWRGYCGGSLITERWVLTAAHCLIARGLNFPKNVKVGQIDSDVNNQLELFRAIDKIYRHPAYDRARRQNEIGLAHVDREVIFTKFVRPACLHAGDPIKERAVVATGWDVASIGMTVPHLLQKVVLDKFSDEQCTRVFPSGTRMAVNVTTEFCAGPKAGVKDTCQGDSGGPVQIYNGDQVECTYLIMGLKSHGPTCADGTPSIYTRVSPFIPWIESIVWP